MEDKNYDSEPLITTSVTFHVALAESLTRSNFKEQKLLGPQYSLSTRFLSALSLRRQVTLSLFLYFFLSLSTPPSLPFPINFLPMQALCEAMFILRHGIHPAQAIITSAQWSGVDRQTMAPRQWDPVAAPLSYPSTPVAGNLSTQLAFSFFHLCSVQVGCLVFVLLLQIPAKLPSSQDTCVSQHSSQTCHIVRL